MSFRKALRRWTSSEGYVPKVEPLRKIQMKTENPPKANNSKSDRGN